MSRYLLTVLLNIFWIWIFSIFISNILTRYSYPYLIRKCLDNLYLIFWFNILFRIFFLFSDFTSYRTQNWVISNSDYRTIFTGFEEIDVTILYLIWNYLDDLDEDTYYYVDISLIETTGDSLKISISRWYLSCFQATSNTSA